MISILQIGTCLSRCLLLLDHLVHLHQDRVDLFGLHTPQVRPGLLGVQVPQVVQEHGAVRAPGHGEPGGQAVAADPAAVLAISSHDAPLKPRCRRGFSRSLIGSQGLDDTFEFPFELPMASLPAREVGGEPGFDLLRLAARPLEEKAVKVERDERQHLPTTLPHESALLLEGFVDFVVDPPTRQGGLGTA
jgi:hypothetical protein